MTAATMNLPTAGRTFARVTVALVASHVVAAAIVIPVLGSRLDD